MADLDLTHGRAKEVAMGAAQFHELREDIRDAVFNRLLEQVDLKSTPPQMTDDPNDYMWIVERIKLALSSILNASEPRREGFYRALAAVLTSDVSGYSLDRGFDAIAETTRAYEGRVETRPHMA